MITVVTDTSAGYSRAEIESRGVRLISIAYLISGIPYSEQPRGENGDFAERMRGRSVKTSQPASVAFTRIFEECTEGGGEVLCILLSGALSGTYSSAVRAAEPFGKRVRVFDSGTTNGGLHLLVDEAVNMIVGNLSLDEICHNLEELKKKISVVFSVETLEPLKKGGRLPSAEGAATTLNSRPIFVLEDSIRFVCNVRGGKSRVKALVDAVPDTARRIFLMKTEGGDTTAIEEALTARFPHIKIHLRTVGPVLTAHLGEGAVGIAYISR
ncbi:MAG: DegV family protein [Clostridiales bacterium]|nr:DegV family protein [Clostridiales bacterium]